MASALAARRPRSSIHIYKVYGRAAGRTAEGEGPAFPAVQKGV